jgi:hypothetical protein
LLTKIALQQFFQSALQYLELVYTEFLIVRIGEGVAGHDANPPFMFSLTKHTFNSKLSTQTSFANQTIMFAPCDQATTPWQAEGTTNHFTV